MIDLRKLLGWLLAVAFCAACWGLLLSRCWAFSPSLVSAVADRHALSKSIHWANVGNSAATPPGFRIGRGILTNGWGPFVEQCGRVVESTRCRGVWIHNPFGDSGEWPMRFDQRVILLETIRTTEDRELKQKLERLERTFYFAWKRYLSGEFTPSQKKPHVWFYLGTVLHNPSMDAVQGDPVAFRKRWYEGVEPILLLAQEFPGQVSLACDRHNDLPAEHPQHWMLASLSHWMEVIIEPRPLATHKHLHSFGVCQLVREGGWDRSDPVKFPYGNSALNASDEQIKGHRYALIARQDREGLDAARRIVHERGWTPLQDLSKWGAK